MAQGLSKETRLTEYLRGLYEGKGNRAWYDRFRDDLESADPWSVNHAIHLLIEDEADYPRIEKAVARFIRAAGKGLERTDPPVYPEAHPLSGLTEENRTLQNRREQVSAVFMDFGRLSPEDSRYRGVKDRFLQKLKTLFLLRDHYHHLQYSLFPALEECGGEFGCLKLMWHIQEGILRDLKESLALLEKPGSPDQQELNRLIGSFFLKSGSLIYREERILYPLAFRALSPDRLPALTAELKRSEGFDPESGPQGGPSGKVSAPAGEGAANDLLTLSRGRLNPGLIDLMLKNLPLDITLVDESGRVRYYSEGKERIFPRSPGIIGREVENCHPPASVGVVKKIVEELKTGRREKAEFWINRDERFIHIQYLPLFDHGVYRGIMEVSQDVTHLRSLEGERRLLDD